MTINQYKSHKEQVESLRMEFQAYWAPKHDQLKAMICTRNLIFLLR